MSLETTQINSKLNILNIYFILFLNTESTSFDPSTSTHTEKWIAREDVGFKIGITGSGHLVLLCDYY